jgi:hypothetical protein
VGVVVIGRTDPGGTLPVPGTVEVVLNSPGRASTPPTTTRREATTMSVIRTPERCFGVGGVKGDCWK